MKGLIYKDIIVGKTDVIALAFIAVYFGAFLALINVMGETTADDKFTFTANTLLGGMFAMNFSLPSIGLSCGSEDSKTKWNNYAMALPGGYKRMLLEKYLMGLFGQAIAVVISLIAIFACAKLSNLPKKAFNMYLMIGVGCLMLLVGVALIVQATLLPMILRGKTGLIQVLAIVLLIGIWLGGVAYLAFGDISFFTKGHLFERIITYIVAHRKKIWLMLSGLVATGAILEFLSYRLTVFLYGRD